VSDDQAKNQNATVIKKYANRRLYNTATSTYVTLEDLSQMVRSGTDFIVYDAKTGEDITRSVLTQIIFDEENKGTQNLLPINFLRQLIRFYGDSMQGVVPGFLDLSMDSLMKDQDKIRKQMIDTFGGTAEPLKGLEEQAKRNMTLFQEAMKAFNPFLAGMAPGGLPTGFPTGFPAGFPGMPGGDAAAKPKPEAPKSDDLQGMKDQLSAMQQMLDKLARGT
jgi:polyhydroxyalkanoate synthesis repressor PhaR